MRWPALIFVSAMGFLGLGAKLDAESRAVRELTRYVEDWAKNLPRSYRRALRHVQSVAHLVAHRIRKVF